MPRDLGPQVQNLALDSPYALGSAAHKFAGGHARSWRQLLIASVHWCQQGARAGGERIVCVVAFYFGNVVHLAVVAQHYVFAGFHADMVCVGVGEFVHGIVAAVGAEQAHHHGVWVGVGCLAPVEIDLKVHHVAVVVAEVFLLAALHHGRRGNGGGCE